MTKVFSALAVISLLCVVGCSNQSAGGDPSGQIPLSPAGEPGSPAAQEMGAGAPNTNTPR